MKRGKEKKRRKARKGGRKQDGEKVILDAGHATCQAGALCYIIATFFFLSMYYFQYPVLGRGAANHRRSGNLAPRRFMANGAEPVDCVGNGNLPFAGHRVPQRLTQQRAPSLPWQEILMFSTCRSLCHAWLSWAYFQMKSYTIPIGKMRDSPLDFSLFGIKMGVCSFRPESKLPSTWDCLRLQNQNSSPFAHFLSRLTRPMTLRISTFSQFPVLK